MKYIRRELFAFANFIVLLISFPILSLMLTFVTYVHLNDVPLSAANAFGTLALFNVLRFPLMELGQILSVCTQAFIALQRIAKFVFQSETGVIGTLKIKQNANSGEINNKIVKIPSKTSFMWTADETQDNSPASTGFRLNRR